jgi:hypothetical protein
MQSSSAGRRLKEGIKTHREKTSTTLQMCGTSSSILLDLTGIRVVISDGPVRKHIHHRIIHIYLKIPLCKIICQ